jgi:hypothetical protein
LITAGTFNYECIPPSVHTIIETGELSSVLKKQSSVRYCHILSHPMLGLIGASMNDEGIYHYNPDYYYIENSSDGMLMYTSFMQKLMPVVRLRSRHWGRVIEPGLLEIMYRGTH